MLVVCGLNQQTPIIYREQVVVNPNNSNVLLYELLLLPGISACVILSTCHRIEIYAEVQNTESLMDWWKSHHEVIWPEIEPFFYCLEDQEAKSHCLRVACGIESTLLGEPQILGQLKLAYHQAHEAGATNQELNNWFEFVFHSAKKIRHDSGINLHPISVASVAVDCIYKYFQENIQACQVFIIGSGDTARLAALHLREKGVTQFKVTSRHLEHAENLAIELQGEAIAVTELERHLHCADIIVTATSCPYPFITQASIRDTLTKRQQKPMYLVDLAVPRDIEASVGLLDEIQLINIDHLQEIQAQNTAERTKACDTALQMTKNALEDYAKKRRLRQANHVICDYRSQMQLLASLEVSRAEQKLKNGQCQFEVLNELAQRLIQKLIHHPTIGLQEAAINEREDLLELANYLFNSEQITS